MIFDNNLLAELLTVTLLEQKQRNEYEQLQEGYIQLVVDTVKYNAKHKVKRSEKVLSYGFLGFYFLAIFNAYTEWQKTLKRKNEILDKIKSH